MAAKDYLPLLGEVQGKNSECASLTKCIAGLPSTSTWTEGSDIRISPPPVGTPVATFNFDNLYGPPTSPGGASQVSHTGIYLGQDDKGVYLFHQYSSSGGARIDRIRWEQFSNGNKYEAGSQYKTIVTK
jgi:hypothetical protein